MPPPRRRFRRHGTDPRSARSPARRRIPPAIREGTAATYRASGGRRPRHRTNSNRPRRETEAARRGRRRRLFSSRLQSTNIFASLFPYLLATFDICEFSSLIGPPQTIFLPPPLSVSVFNSFKLTLEPSKSTC